MEFLDIASLGISYRYVVKIDQKFKKKRTQGASWNRWVATNIHLDHKQETNIPTMPLPLRKFAHFRGNLGVEKNASLAKREC
jgi:hypothetical protein